MTARALRDRIAGRVERRVQRLVANTISALITVGFTPKSVIAAVRAQDFSLLERTGATLPDTGAPAKAEDGGTP